MVGSVVAVVLLVFVVTGCNGGSDAGGSAEVRDTSTSGASDSAGAGALSQAAETTTTKARAEDGNTETAVAGRSVGMVTIGDARYRFVVDEDGTCDPDFYGTFRAFMSLVDESGDPVEVEGESGPVGQGIAISVSADAEGLIGGELDGVLWSAGADDYEESSIDLVEIDGNRVMGTATFVSPDGGGPVGGTFEVTCVGEG
jgi:hypothetical protein